MDEGDRAQVFQENEEAKSNSLIKQISKEANAMPKGFAGECDYCGNYSKRIVNNACAPCRDEYNLG